MDAFLGFNDLQIKFFAAAGQLGLTAAVAYIAYRQWKTARNKLKSDIFDKRFSVYQGILDQVEQIRRDETVSSDPRPALNALAMLRRRAKEIDWLFGPTAGAIAAQIPDYMHEYVIYQIDAANAPHPDKMLALNRVVLADEALDAALDALTRIVGSDLTLKH